MSGATNQILKLHDNLQRSRRAVLYKGGTVGEVAAFDNLPGEIESIPAGDANYVLVNDTDVAYRKQILPGALPLAKLKSIGGMTYKSENLLNPALFDETKEMVSGLTATNNGDGSITISGDGYVELYSMAYILYSGTRFNADGMYLSIDKTLPENLAICAYGYPTNEEGNYQGETFYWITGDSTSVALSGWVSDIFITRSHLAESNYVVADNLTIKPMLSRGSVKPYEPYYEGLRDSKVTALKVYGANLFNDAAFLQSHGFTLKEDGYWHGETQWQDIWVNTEQREGQISISYTVELLSIEGTNQYYPMFFYVYYTDGTYNQIATLVYNASGIKYIKGTSTAGKTVKKVLWGSSQKGTLRIKDIMLNRGDTPASYFPYKAEPTTYTIPSAVQALDLYGHGVTDSNTAVTHTGVVDLNNEQYINPLRKLVLDGVSEGKKATKVQQLNGYNNFLLAIDGTYASPRALDITHFNVNYANNAGNAYLIGAQLSLFPYDQTLTTLPTFNAWLKEMYDKGTPVECVYAVAEPEVTDISAELEGFDPIISIEPTCEVEVVNEPEHAVPNTIAYLRRIT